MKVFHLVSNKEWGGGEQYVYDLCQRQMADGLSVSVFCRPVEGVVERFRGLTSDLVESRLGGVFDLRSACRLARAIRQSGPCVLHAHNFKDAFTAVYARWLSGNREARVIVCRHLTRPGKNSLIYRWLYRQLDVLYFGSELSKKVFLSTHPAISECKLDVVRPGTPVPQKIEPVDLRKELGIADNEVLAMYHGRLAAEKGLDVLVESIDRIRDEKFRLVLIGRGSNDYVTHLRQLIESRGLQQKILLAGFRQPVLPCVAAADLGILVSIVPEGCGLSLQEYMSQGRPVITTNNGGQSDFVFDNRNGLLVPPGDAQALAATLSRLINDSALRQKLGEQATADFRDHLNYERFYEQIKCLYGINR
ncbi:glycosyltransferase family 4 protein [uncultured Prevotella sp.]|uniref:glycosyltransferase family 4 protein n=1 Tax=uncultured Prevotella sp. TaxID=159272 RepID=UPI00258D1311|nr:glycosyltransferase family 4 protein [uncultured Prevotella sp.]